MNGTILLIKTIAAHRYLFTFLDSVVYEKVVAALTDSRLVKTIMQASPIAQTSCLEGFHSVLNHFCPKMISFSYVGMFAGLCSNGYSKCNFYEVEHDSENYKG